MTEAFIIAGIPVVVAAIGGAYALGRNQRASRNGNSHKPELSQFVTKETCALQRQVDELKVCKKLNAIMTHLGIEEGKE